MQYHIPELSLVARDLVEYEGCLYLHKPKLRILFPEGGSHTTLVACIFMSPVVGGGMRL